MEAAVNYEGLWLVPIAEAVFSWKIQHPVQARPRLCARRDIRVLSSVQLPVVPLWLLSYLAARGGAAANDCERRMANIHHRTRERLGLGGLIVLHIIICCLSLIRLADYEYPIAFDPTEFHIFFNPARLHIAVLAVGSFAFVSLLFTVARFSFGYFVGFYLYTMVLSYLWLNCFTDLNYDHRLAGFSAGASAVALLLPALFITAPLRQIYVLTATEFDRLLVAILLLATAVVVIGAAYNFRLVAIEDIYDFRDQIVSPKILNYLTGITSSALLPFAFAGFAARRAYWRAGAVLVLFLCMYPVTLSKVVLFTPFFLAGILVLSKLFEARIAVVLSLLGPILAGLVLVQLFGGKAALYLSFVNHRMMAVPAIALDVYTDFFSKHDLTYFCQMSFSKYFVSCPYQEPLSIVMERTYRLGNFNASLFATEGVASVGLLFAPIAVFACGLVIALGNRLSAGLPASFILLSGAVLPHIILNVPLSTTLLSHGAIVLFLLWYLTPRSMFRQQAASETPLRGHMPPR